MPQSIAACNHVADEQLAPVHFTGVYGFIEVVMHKLRERWPPDGGDPGVPQARLGLLNYEPTHAPGAFDLDHVGGVRAITPHESEHHVGMLWACRATIWTHRSIERDDEAGNGEERVHADEAAGAGYADQDGKASRSEA